MHKQIQAILFIFLLLLLVACSANKNKTGDTADSIILNESTRAVETINRTKSFFYNLYLPCDLPELFTTIDAEYDPSLVNPIKNLDYYNSSLKKALNLGVYGVDLGYVRMYEQQQASKKYFYAINKLSNQMGIKSDYVNSAIEYFENNITSKDSLYKITCEVYETTDKFLNENERESAAVLIIFGGWVEALYITANMAKESSLDDEIMKRIARQKYSLNSLISLLNLYQDHLLVTNYLTMIESLKKDFDDVELYFEKEEDIHIDTINRIISTKHAQVKITPQQFLSIKRKITTIRNTIINY